MPDRVGRPRAWYLNPSDPTTVRHWDGDRWSRVRGRPTWSISAGELVVDTEGRFDTSRPWGGPVVEGPARPAAQRAAAGVLGMGSEPTGGKTRPALWRSGAATDGPDAQHLPPAGAGGDVVPGPPWSTSRRPLAILAVMVILAAVGLAATVGSPSAPPSVPSDFVDQAGHSCRVMLGTNRPRALPADGAGVSLEVTQLTTLANHLQTLASSTGATVQISNWFASWRRFVAAEQQRAAALGTPTLPSPTSPPPASLTTGSPDAPPGGVHAEVDGPDPATLARQSQTEADVSDHFAELDNLPACTILARGPAPILSIPS